jgi:tetratricopeptide (TPR) repeat protein
MMAEAHQRMGDIFQSVGQYAEARQQYEQSHFIRQTLARTDSRRNDTQRNLALSFSKLGDISFLEGQTPQAHEHYGQALKLRETIVAEYPDSEEAQIDLATSYVTLGKVSEGEQARSYYMHALKLRQALAARAPESSRASRERDVWIISNKLAELSLKLQDLASARQYYDQALSQATTLSVLVPNSTRAKVDLALAYVNIGNVLLQSGERQEANETFEQALSLLRPLAKNDPQNLELQTNLVIVLARRGDHAEAAQKAEQLRSLAPQNFLNLYNIACCYALCAAALEHGSQELTSEEQAAQRDYGEKAIHALRQATARGLKVTESVTADPDLSAIRAHPEYSKLLAELE